MLKPEAKERFPHSKVSSVKLFLKTTLNALNIAKKFHQREMKSSLTSSQPSLSSSSSSFVNEKEVNNKINETLTEEEMKMFFSSILEQLLIIKYFLEKNYNNNGNNKTNNNNNTNTNNSNYINNNNNTDNNHNNINNNNMGDIELDLNEDEIVIDDNDDVNDDDDFLPDKRINKNNLQSSKIQSNKREEIKMIGKSHIYFLHPEEFRTQLDIQQNNSNNCNYQSFLPPLTNLNEFILLSSYQNYLIALTLLLMLGQRPSFILNSTFDNTMVKEGRLAFAPRVEKTLRSEYHPIVSSSPFFLIEEKDYFTQWVNNFRKLFIRVSLKVNPHLINNNYAIKRSITPHTPSSSLSTSTSVYDSVIQI